MAQPALFALGFVYGATESLAAGNHYQNLAPNSYTTQLHWRITDTIAEVTGQRVNVGGVMSGQSFKFNPTGFLNKGLVAAVAAWVYKEMKLPYAKEMYKAVFPFGAGYSIGGFFDPAGATAPGVGGASSGLIGGYAAAPLGYAMGGQVMGNVPLTRAEGGASNSPPLV